MSTGDHDLLFGVTALQLRFITQENLAEATGALSGDAEGLRGKLCELGLLTPAEADAVSAVVEQRLARFDNDAKKTLESVSGDHATTGLRGGRPTISINERATRAPRQEGQEIAGAVGERFTVLRLHQKGGLGRLMIALDSELNREIALKEILPRYADHMESRRRFIREAEITGNLEHPGIVPVYSLGEFADGRPYYAMRFVRGADMLAAIEDFHAREGDWGTKEFEFRQLVGRLVSACHAIDYAHNRGVIHRDLKPSNIMVGDFGETLVVDWGLARAMDEKEAPNDSELPRVTPSDRAQSDRTQAGRLVGTLPYMAPEQAAGRLDLLGPATDVYGLGATLYHLLTGQAPFAGDRDDIAFRVEQGRYARPRSLAPEIPRPLEAICMKAMARRSGDRYSTARELALDLERWLADQPVTALAEPLSARAWRWIRRHRAAVLTAMAATVALTAALGAGLVAVTAANRREREARREADANLAASVREQERAERNFKLAQDAVRRYFIDVSEETLLNQPGMQPLRDSLLRQALGYYQEFLKQRADDPAMRREVAQANFFVGRVGEMVESASAAQPNYEVAARLQGDLLKSADEMPADERDGLSIEHGQTLNALGRVMQKQQRLEEAESYYRQAAEIRERLSAAAPNDAERAFALASSVMNMGLVELARGDGTEGLATLDRAQTIRLAHTHVDSAGGSEVKPAFVRDLAMGYFNLGTARLAHGDPTGSEAPLGLAAKYFERLTEAAPNDLESRRRLANCRRLLGDAKSAAGDLEGSMASYEQSRNGLRELAERNPDVPDYLADLAGAEMNLGFARRTAGDAAGALEDMLSAASALEKLTTGGTTGQPRQRSDYGVALRAAGQLLGELDRKDEAREKLEKSRDALAALVREFPDQATFAAELKLTIEALDELEAI